MNHEFSRAWTLRVVLISAVCVAGSSANAAFAAKKTTATTKVERTLAKAALAQLQVEIPRDTEGAAAPASSVVPSSGSGAVGGASSVSVQGAIGVQGAATATTLPSSKETVAVIPVQAAGASAPWRCPVPGAKFTNDYGSPRSGGRAHAGTDMLAPRGTPIVAPISGIVRHDSSSLAGLSFYLDAPDGTQLFGAHLSAYGAQGQVEAGTIIGYVGDSGNARGTPHLHFEVHPTKKTKTNPYPTLKQIC